ncbi:hypothetical protein M0Q50_02590 [bacterium]|jgi:hypothetical protein|nr:hypothetical protein [bacterium]
MSTFFIVLISVFSTLATLYFIWLGVSVCKSKQKNKQNDIDIKNLYESDSNLQSNLQEMIENVDDNYNKRIVGITDDYDKKFSEIYDDISKSSEEIFNSIVINAKETNILLDRRFDKVYKKIAEIMKDNGFKFDKDYEVIIKENQETQEK